MSAGEDDLLRLRHMLDAAREVSALITEASRADLDTDRKLLRALSMSVGIIGEAASEITPAFRDAHPEFPWRQMIGMRNYLFHVYFKIDNDILWETAVQSIPALIPLLEESLPDD